MDAGANVWFGQVGIVVGDDFGKRNAFADEFEDIVDGNARAVDAGFAEVDV
jgi:hypothetical protein